MEEKGKKSGPPEELAKIGNGLNKSLERQDVCDYNYPNYSFEDIVIKNMDFKVSEYDPKINGNHVSVTGDCIFDQSSKVPEMSWEHISSTIFILVINQGGKAAQNLTSTVNGIALRKFNCNIKKPSPLEDISFKFDSRIYVKMKTLWVNSNWDFFHSGNKIADFDILSIGIQRDYSNLVAKKQKTN